MQLSITAHLSYHFTDETDVLLQVEAALLDEQIIRGSNIKISDPVHFARVPAHDMIGERIWLRVDKQLSVDYSATVAITRLLSDCKNLEMVPPHQLPGETVQYLFPSRYCPSDLFLQLAHDVFPIPPGGERIVAMRDWVHDTISYVHGSSNAGTTAVDTFQQRQGVCRDFAHLLICLARASGIPARIASVYALGVKPQDFHAVAEVFLGGEWHLVDPTGMAQEGAMAKIGVGRDAADVSFLTAYGPVTLLEQTVSVNAVR